MIIKSNHGPALDALSDTLRRRLRLTDRFNDEDASARITAALADAETLPLHQCLDTLRKVLNPGMRNNEWSLLSEPSFATTATSEWLQRRLDAAAITAAHARALSWQCRVTHAIRETPNWFWVMDTLTIAPKDMHRWQECLSDLWQTYKRRIEHAAGIAHLHSRRAVKATPTANYCRHLAVIEYGTKTGRPHLHCLWAFRTLPWPTDPNASASVPYKREIAGMKVHWPHGFSAPIAIRFHATDAYGQLHWRWPSDQKGTPIRTGSPAQIGGYLAKYLTKTTDHDRGFSWRTRATRNLGLKPILNALRTAPTHLLRPLHSPWTIPDQTQPLSYPRHTTRRLAWRERLRRISESTGTPGTIRLLKTIATTRNRPPTLLKRLQLFELWTKTRSAECAAFLDSLACLKSAPSSDRQQQAMAWLSQAIPATTDTTSTYTGGQIA